jgi:hypothetical protein
VVSTAIPAVGAIAAFGVVTLSDTRDRVRFRIDFR